VSEPTQPRTRRGSDSIEVKRIARLLSEGDPEDLRKIFASDELADAGEGASRAVSLAARFAAKEACLKIFPRERELKEIELADFSVRRNGHGNPSIVPSRRAQRLLDQYRLGDIEISLAQDGERADAVAVASLVRAAPGAAGRLIYHLLPVRRRTIMRNLRRVFGGKIPDEEIVRLAQASYGHFARLIWEFACLSVLSEKAKSSLVRVENDQAIRRAHELGHGILILTGHFGNWELIGVAAIVQFPQYRDRFHFLRKPLRPALLDAMVKRRFRRAGLDVIESKGSLYKIIDALAASDAVAFVMDQHAGGRDGVSVDFFGVPANTFRSLAIIALQTGAPVVPCAAYRDRDGKHVLQFDEALPAIGHDDPNEAIRLNTRAYNEALERMVLRHPEQWFWMHNRWKAADGSTL
jgi:KDO2-lipid IV(A) lauroyltransferase